MSWIDHLLAVPAIGLRINPAFHLSGRIPTLLEPLLDRLYEEDGELSVPKAEELAFAFQRPSGLRCKVEVTDVVVTFSYPVGPVAVPGKLPSTRNVEVRRYSEILDDLVETASEVISLLTHEKPLKLNRAGIVCDMNIEFDKQAPGFDGFYGGLASQVRGELIKSDTALLSILKDSADQKEQCHHHLSFDQTQPEQGVRIKLDWQRLWAKGIDLDQRTFLDIIQSCRTASMDHFSKFATGGSAHE